MSEAQLDWGSAAVKDGRLTVEIDGELPSGWKRSFRRIVTLLDRGDWGEIDFKKGAVHVGRVHPGDEEKLRHFLESAVAQANADHRSPDAESDPTESDQPPADDGGDDALMTERFRAYAESRR